MTKRESLMAFGAIATLLSAIAAEAQWVMVARAVSGRIQQMTNKPSNGAGYDVATVILEANPDKVYETAVNSLQSHAGLPSPTKCKKREVKFAKSGQVGSLQAIPLGDKLTQLVIGVQPDRGTAQSHAARGSRRAQGLHRHACELHFGARLVGRLLFDPAGLRARA